MSWSMVARSHGGAHVGKTPLFQGLSASASCYATRGGGIKEAGAQPSLAEQVLHLDARLVGRVRDRLRLRLEGLEDAAPLGAGELAVGRVDAHELDPLRGRELGLRPVAERALHVGEPDGKRGSASGLEASERHLVVV